MFIQRKEGVIWRRYRWCLVLLRLSPIALLAAAFQLAEAVIPRVDNSSTTTSGKYIYSTAWHARTLTNISWNIPVGEVHTLHLIVISLKEAATESWRFENSGNNTRAETPPSQTTSWTSYFDREYYYPPLTADEALSTSCEIQYGAYTASPNDTFYQQEQQEQVTPVLVDSSTWWYTASLDQEEPTATSLSSTVGTASVWLSAPGLYAACLLVGNETCYKEECINITVYQPPDDFIEIESTNVGTSTTVVFNLVSRYAYPGDWGWILGGVNPSFTVAEADELSATDIISQFEQRCWFYFGRAIELDAPFVCSPDPDSTLASLQSASAVRAYQYGRFEFYSSFAGNESLWFSKHEYYTFVMIQSFYTCGITVQTLDTSTVNTTTDLVVTAIPEHGPSCAVGDGIELWIRTDHIISPTVTDVDAWTYFSGRLVNTTSEETKVSIRLPYKERHSIKIYLIGGALLDTLYVTAVASDPYAPLCKVTASPPGSLPIGSSIQVSLMARDYYSNTISRPWGDDAFQAWTFNSAFNQSVATVVDDQDGYYSVTSSIQNVTGTTFLFVERNGLGVSGSPFEVYFFGPSTCQSISRVGECGSSLTRKVEQEWAVHSPCNGFFDAPTSDDISCGYVPVNSSVGKLVIACSTFAVLYAALYLAWIRRHRQAVITKLSQPFVCQLFLVGCILLNLTNMLHVGKPIDISCVMRPWLLHVALTFTSSCLYLKTYRVHRIFNSTKISRISITDRQLVIWALQLVAVDMLVLSIWMVAERPRRVDEKKSFGTVEAVNPVCTGESRLLSFSSVLWVWKACLNVFGIIMAAKTWHCEDGVGESQPICLSVYNTTLLGLINLAIYFILDDKIGVVVGASTLTAVAGSIFTISVLFGPKVYRLWFHGDLPANPADRRNSSTETLHPRTLDRRRSSATGTLTASALGFEFCKTGKVQPVENLTLSTGALTSTTGLASSTDKTHDGRGEGLLL